MTEEQRKKDMEHWEEIFAQLEILNPNITEHRKDFRKTSLNREHRLQKVLVANRGEIAKRFFFALHEEGIPSVAVITDPDIGQSWYDFAGEVVHIGDSINYSTVDVIISAAIMSGANAIYPGYGFLSENPAFVRRINEASEFFGREIIFMGPSADVMEGIGDKVRARMLARSHGISLLAGADNVESVEEGLEAAHRTGYPVMVKLSAGGGGRGIIPCRTDDELRTAVEDVQRVGKSLFNDTRFFVEKMVERPVHIEVQIFNGYAIGLRKCAVQRRHQKIIEESAQFLVDDSTALSMLAQAQIIAKISGYADGGGAGTVEYLFDPAAGSFGFLEVNTRLQVEYAVTEQSLGIDLVRWQIALFDGREKDIPIEETLRNRLRPPCHAIECRVYAEDPSNGYTPSPGLITEVVLPTFNGVRCDFGFAAQDRVASVYDAMIGKVIAYGSSRDEAIIRLERALQEIYIRGLHTNIKQLLTIVRHPEFKKGQYTNKILEEFPELLLPAVSDGTKYKKERRGRSTIALGTLTEYIRLMRRKSSAFIQSQTFNVSGGKRGLIPLAYKFTVEYNMVKYKVEIYAVSLEKYYIIIDGEYSGKVFLTSSNISRGEYIFRYGNGSYRLRVDRRTKYLSIKIKDSSNKVNYYKLAVFPEGTGETEDPAGLVRAPFQCTFVSLAQENRNSSAVIHPGSWVKQGDPVMIISSMKMETRIFAPVTGRVGYIIEEGRLDHLVLGTTSDGRILGKSIQEGEVLISIEQDNEETWERDQTEEAVGEGKKHYADGDIIYLEDVETEFVRDPGKIMPVILEFLHAGIGGFIHKPGFFTEITRLLEKADSDLWRKILTPEMEQKICSLITFYYNILQLFSPLVRGNGFSFQEDLNYYIRHLDSYDYSPEYVFRTVIMAVLEQYGIRDLKPSIEGDNNMTPVAFFNLQNAYFFCSENKNVIRKLIRILSCSENRLPSTARVLETIISHEQSEPDDSVAQFARTVLASKFADTDEIMIYGSETFTGISASEFISRFMSSSSVNAERLMAEVWDSLDLEKVNAAGFYGAPSSLADKINILGKKFHLTSLYSPWKDILIWSALDPENEDSGSYIAFVLMKNYLDMDQVDVPYSLLKKGVFSDALDRACRVITMYNLLHKREKNRIEMIATDSVLRSDPVSNGIGSINFTVLKDLSLVAAKYFSISGADSVLFYFDVACRDGEWLSKIYKLQKKEEGFVLDLLAEKDPRNPYNEITDSREAHLFSMKKWPVEIWADECFDNGEYEELLIDTVDFNVPEKYSRFEAPLAARIFTGRINSRKVCFYMKDSRISGGATGDLEGLKYAAAVYISVKKQWPLYVWNDGAGANVAQGIISINRASEGFMMNAMSSNMEPEQFLNEIRGASDKRLTDLFDSMDRQYFGGDRTFHKGETFYYITAVGIGSSAGLDVYGSSQAPVQILLDNEFSYRTLTGSAIIRFVTGEDISNYEIGGARVMSKWAGIVDLVAGGKYRLISEIRRLNDMFSFEKQLPAINRTDSVTGSKAEDGHFSEEDVEANTDDGNFIAFKQDYYGSSSVVAGFGKLAGRRTLILGTRSPEGLRSFQSVIRAHDVLRSASKLRVPAVLVFSEKWHQNAELYDIQGVRARMDFIKELAAFRDLKICIITDIAGFHCIEIISSCDIIIFVQNGTPDAIQKDFVERNAAFIVPVLSEAFDLAAQLINLLKPVSVQPCSVCGKPEIPDDPGIPYNMETSVIRQILDEGEFYEFFAGMNSIQTRPNFITGLGRLNGETVAVLADQPLVMGGAADAPNTEKFRVFIQFASRMKLKVLMLSNSSGFIPGARQERIRIQAIGAETLDCNILSQVPVVSVVLNQSFGGRQAQAFGRLLRPGIYSIARENASMSVIGIASAFNLLKGKKYSLLASEGKTEEAEEMKRMFTEEKTRFALARNDAMSSGALDMLLVNMSDLRESIIHGFSAAAERCRKTSDLQ